jgi:hypothetical protein
MCLRVIYKKKYENRILKVTEERSRIQSWIRIHESEVWIWMRPKMSLIPNTEAYVFSIHSTNEWKPSYRRCSFINSTSS